MSTYFIFVAAFISLLNIFIAVRVYVTPKHIRGSVYVTPEHIRGSVYVTPKHIPVKDSFFGNRIFKIKSNTIVVIKNIFI